MTEHYNSKILKYQLCFCLIPDTVDKTEEVIFITHGDCIRKTK